MPVKFHYRSTSGFRDTKKILRRFIALCAKTVEPIRAKLSPGLLLPELCKPAKKFRKLNVELPRKSRLNFSKKLRAYMQNGMRPPKREQSHYYSSYLNSSTLSMFRVGAGTPLEGKVRQARRGRVHGTPNQR